MIFCLHLLSNSFFPIHKCFHLVEGPPPLLMEMCVSEVPAMGVRKTEVVSEIVWSIYFVSVSKNQRWCVRFFSSQRITNRKKKINMGSQMLFFATKRRRKSARLKENNSCPIVRHLCQIMQHSAKECKIYPDEERMFNNPSAPSKGCINFCCITAIKCPFSF